MSGGRPRADYTRCPKCGYRTVLFHFGRNGEDYLKCTRPPCDFAPYRNPESWDTQGTHDIAQWELLNDPLKKKVVDNGESVGTHPTKTD